MMETLQLAEAQAEAVVLHDEPKLLVEWTPRWPDFVSSIGPALSRSEARLAGEAPFGLIPLRIMLPSYVLEAFLILAAIFVQIKIAELQPQVITRPNRHEVIYYSGDELPQMEDLGGSEAGKSGRAGGEEAHHRTQTIRIARGPAMTPQVVDAPNLRLPSSTENVANLLAVRPDAGPPPAEGLRSARSAPSLAANVVAPAPNVIHDYTRNGVKMDAVIAPPPDLTINRAATAPSLSATLIPPPPEVKDDHRLIAPRLAPAVIPPAPNVSRSRVPGAPSLTTNVIAPAPNVTQDRSRQAPTIAANIIPPAPAASSRQLSSSLMQMTNAAVVPPPVSAPQRDSMRTSKLTLPAPAVVAPPPSANLSSDMRRLASGSVADPVKNVIPPPPSQQGSGSFVSSLIGKLFGTAEVVPPPPSVNGSSAANGSGTAPSLASHVIPPPPSFSGSSNSGAGANAGGNPRGTRTGAGSSLGTAVVAPPPSIGSHGGTGTNLRGAAPYLGSQGVVPPPPSLSGLGGGSGNTGGGAAAPGGSLIANNIVPPPPSVGGGAGASGSGMGRRGNGLGLPLDAGSNLAPPASGGSGGKSGAVVSTQPGTKVGMPANGGPGSVAMSPSGGDKPGMGGAGGGTGMGHGDGPGSGMTGTGGGAAKSGAGRGASTEAHGGISPTNGPGGAGSATSGNPPVRGVEVSGGSSIVTLPSFGDDPAANSPTSAKTDPKHGRHDPLEVTVVATASSGSAFEPYKNLLHGETYTTYIETTLGPVVMEFADEAASGHPLGGTIKAPAPIETDLASGLPHARMVVTCTVDTKGNLQNVRVLEAGPAGMTARVVAALRTWKFEPATRSNQPVEVTAILGFGIDTNDRF